MKQQISALVLVLVFLAGLGIPAMAAGEKLEKIPQITVTIPDSNDFQITFTNAGSLYSLYDESDGQRITFFCYNDTTVMFNKAVTLSYGLNSSPRTIKAGESIDFFSLTDGDPDISFSGKSKSLFIMFMPAGSESGFSNLMPLANLAPADPNAPSDWASAEIESAIAAGLVPETLQKNYKSDVSRGTVAQMFINLLEKSSGVSIDDFLKSKGAMIDESAFTDTKDNAVLAANALGIINGVGNGKFDPGATFERAQIAAIINRAARVLGVNTEGYTHAFTDVKGHWADSELGWPVHAGIINGVGGNKFDPNGKLTTEQAIAITYRALEALK